jgi:hypothetical protein
MFEPARAGSGLDEQLSTAGRPIALFLHKPLFLEGPNDDVVSPSCMVPSARTRLLDKLDRSDVRLIVSGHLHQHRDPTFGGQRHLWVPAISSAPRRLTWARFAPTQDERLGKVLPGRWSPKIPGLLSAT